MPTVRLPSSCTPALSFPHQGQRRQRRAVSPQPWKAKKGKQVFERRNITCLSTDPTSREETGRVCRNCVFLPQSCVKYGLRNSLRLDMFDPESASSDGGLEGKGWRDRSQSHIGVVRKPRAVTSGAVSLGCCFSYRESAASDREDPTCRPSARSRG